MSKNKSPISLSLSLIINTLAPDLNGIGILQLKDRPSGFEKKVVSNFTTLASPYPKKSPKGTSTAGFTEPSQKNCNRIDLSISGERSLTVNHIR